MTAAKQNTLIKENLGELVRIANEELAETGVKEIRGLKFIRSQIDEVNRN